jgi:hypothetical protein
VKAIRDLSARQLARRGAAQLVTREHLAELEAERSRLADELREARTRASVAEAVAAASYESQVRVAALVLAAHRELLDARAPNGDLRAPGSASTTASLVASGAHAIPRAAAPATQRASAGQAPARRGIRRFLYVDTILPLVAVVIVLVVLLAWVE